MYQALADIVLMTHVAFVVVVVAAVPLILVGGCKHWRWIRNFWFRAFHLLGIGIVVLQSWIGIVCPLTTLEMWLRGQAGQRAYDGSFIEHWLQRLLYFDAPAWVFITVYSLFGLLVLSTWVLVPPKLGQGKHAASAT